MIIFIFLIDSLLKEENKDYPLSKTAHKTTSSEHNSSKDVKCEF